MKNPPCPPPVLFSHPTLLDCHNRRERIFSFNGAPHTEEPGSKLPSKLQRRKLQEWKRCLKTGSTHPTEKASSMGDLPLRVQRLGSLVGQVEAEISSNSNLLSWVQRPTPSRQGELEHHRLVPIPAPVPGPSLNTLPSSSGRPEDNLPQNYAE